MTASETGREIPGRVNAPVDVTRLADKVFTRGRKYGQSYRDMIAEAIMADRAARIASLEAERARTVDGLAERLRQQVANADTDIADALADAETTGEVVDPDDWHVEVPVNWLRECIAALASEKGGQADG